MSDVKETSYTISVDNAVQMELAKCVECCADMSSWSGDGPDICYTCYEETKVHLPIPPTCLDLGMYMNESLKSLCYPKGELKYDHTVLFYMTGSGAFTIANNNYQQASMNGPTPKFYSSMWKPVQPTMRRPSTSWPRTGATTNDDD